MTTGTTSPAVQVRVRVADVLVTAVLVVLAGVLAVDNVLADGHTLRVDSHSWWQLPVMVATAVPVLWWRRGLVPVLVASTAVVAVHLVAFGSLVRCGSGLPLTFVLAFLVGLTSLHRPWWPALGLVAVLNLLVLVRDTAAGVGLLPVTLVVCLALFGIGRAVAHRAEMGRDLREHNEQLRLLRDERASLEVTDDRARLSARLEALLDERLGQLATAAEEAALSRDAAATRTALATLEEDSRRTLGDMREIVGLLRGGEVSLAPAPSVAHLDALLARHLGAGSRLRVSGDPRVLPASVELSAYRIVEHLVGALEGASAAVAVGMRFDLDALEIRIEGPVARTADLRGAVGRARERARLHAGSLEVRTGRGQARVVARLPVSAGA